MTLQLDDVTYGKRKPKSAFCLDLTLATVEQVGTMQLFNLME